MKCLLRTIVFLGCVANLLSADILYNIAVNTSAELGQAGYLDFQLGSGPDSSPASVAVQNFTTDGTLNDRDRQISGDVTGMLPGTVTLTNRQQLNDYFAGFAYGSYITFTLDLSGPAINDPAGRSIYGSPFYFGLYDSVQIPIGSSDAFGNALLIQINTNGTTTLQIYNSAVSATNAVPEPRVVSLLSIGFALAIVRLRLLQKR